MAAGSVLVLGVILAIFSATNFWAGASYLVGGLLGSGWFIFGFGFEGMISRSLLISAGTMFGMAAFLHEISNPEFTPELRQEGYEYWTNLKSNRRFYGEGFALEVLHKFEDDYLRYCFVEQYSATSIQMLNAYKSLVSTTELSLMDVTELGTEEQESRCMQSIKSLALAAPSWFGTVYPNMSNTIKSKS